MDTKKPQKHKIVTQTDKKKITEIFSTDTTTQTQTRSEDNYLTRAVDKLRNKCVYKLLRYWKMRYQNLIFLGLKTTVQPDL